MSGEVVKEFLVSLGLETEGASGFDGAVGKATLIVAGLGAAVFAASGALFAFTKVVAEYYDNLGDMSDRTNIAVGAIEEFGYVATMTGSSVEAANSSLESFSRAAGDAANNMGKGKKVFEQLGIQVKDANGNVKETTALLGEVGDKIKDMDRGQQVAILGRLGVDKTLVAALTSDVGGLRDEFQKLYSAVGLDSEAAAEKSGKFMDSLDRLDFVVTTIGRSLAVNFMDRFTEALDSLRKLIVDSLPAIMRVLNPTIKIILGIADAFIAIVYRIAQGAGVIIGWIATIVERTNKWVLIIGLVAAAWRLLNLSFLASPVGIILSLAAAIGLLVDDFMTWQEGGESLIPWDKWKPQIDMALAAFEVLKAAGEQWFNALFAITDAIGKLFEGDIQGALDKAKEAFGFFAEYVNILFGPILEGIKNAFTSAFDYIVGIIDGVMAKVSAVVDSVKGAASAVGSVFGFGGEEEAQQQRFSGSPLAPPALAPSPIQAGGLGAQSIQQQTSIILQGSANSQENAKAIAAQQNSVNGNMARNLKGAVK